MPDVPEDQGILEGMFGHLLGPSDRADWGEPADGDVNGDETADIVWQRPSGHVHYWPMHGGVPGVGVDIDASGIHTELDESWTLVGVGNVR